MARRFVRVSIPEYFNFEKEILRVCIEFGKNGRVKNMLTITERVEDE